MDSLNSGRVAQVLGKLHQDAEVADRDLISELTADFNASGDTLEQAITKLMDSERADYRAQYRSHVHHFLSVSPAYVRIPAMADS